MRVTMLVPPYVDHPVGGMTVYYEYANRLVARGHQVGVHHGWAPEIAQRFPKEALDGFVVPSRHWFSFDARVEVHHSVAYDVPGLPDADVLFNGAIVGSPRGKGVPTVLVQGLGFFSRDAEDRDFAPRGPKLCVSRALVGELLERGIPDDEVFYVPNGVDLSTFRLTRPLEDRPRRVAMLFHVLPVKGTDLGLEALERIRAAVPDVEAVLFGTDPRPPTLAPWIEYRHLPSRSALVEDVYNGSSVLMCPSRKEGFYLCGLEAMATGCAFASTRAGGMLDYSEHEVSALLSPVGDVDALSANVVRLLRDEPLRRRLATAGLSRAREFSWESTVDRLEAALLTSCNAARRRASA
ncbi:MAG TPA: glycosyltransferase family 4 protein [Polyangiaceae bacterium]|nr:glycosyltransferase family 4 protein [Polyangiaceae bacterium]